MNDAQPQPRLAAQRRRRLLAFLLGNAIGGAVVLLLWGLLMRRERLPELTRATLTAAEERWAQHGPKSYDLAIQLKGARPGTFEVEVREGTVTHMTRNGIAPARRETWEVWTVPGMFDTIEADWSKRDDVAQGFATPPGSQLVQLADFDAALGYPKRYYRMIPGTNLDVFWEVTQFRTANGPSDASPDERTKDKP